MKALTTARGILFVLLAISVCAPVHSAAAAAIETERYSPLLYGFWSLESDDQSDTVDEDALNDFFAGTLLGWISESGTLDRGESPLTVGARNDVRVGEDCLSSDSEEDLKARSELLPAGTPLVFLSMDGAELGRGVTAPTMSYICWEANGETELFPDMAELSGLDTDYEGMFIGVHADVAVAPVVTERSEPDDTTIVFAAPDHDIRVVFTKEVIKTADTPQIEQRMTLVQGGQTYDLGNMLFEEPEEIDGAFIDLHADGKPEFLCEAVGVAGSIALYSLDPTKQDNLLFSLDMGE